MRKNLVVACSVAFFSFQAVTCTLAQDKRAGTPEKSPICFCLIEELDDYGYFCEYSAERREHACNPTNCDEPTLVSWYGKASWPQDCEVENDCINFGKNQDRAPMPEKSAAIALDRPATPLFEPPFSAHLQGVAKVVHVDCITISPPDRDPLTAKVFLIFTPAHKIGSGKRQRDVPASVRATGVEVEGLAPSHKADTTVQDAMFKNVYYAKVGCTRYTILTTAKKK